MELPPLFNWFSIVLLSVCVIGIPVLLFVGWIISGVMDNRLNDKREAQNNALRKRGVTSPAVVVSARKNMSRSPFGRKEIRIDYEVDVQPQGQPSFRQSFQNWTTKTSFTAINNQLVDEVGRRIWVTYDPNDKKQMIFEYYDSEREKILAQKEWNSRRASFEKQEKQNQALRNDGEEAVATILEAEDLGLAYQWENAVSMRLKFEVTPKSGSSFHAETQGLIGTASLEKYSVGKKVYVKFDPREPARVAMLRSFESS